ncbi:hypothetical protein niasHS_001877 [Heterodera schachtii]|uniref:Glutathione synthetase n=1 Tax=Heterodera schachtii TaxID=97005 RepID=A0ABD2KAR3_HETSC
MGLFTGEKTAGVHAPQIEIEGTNNLEDIPSGSTNNEAAEDAQQSDQKFLMGQIDEAKKWALANGLITKRERFVPFSLFPSPFPRALFHKAVDVQKSLQLLYFRAMRDFDFLKEMHRAQTETNEEFRLTVDFIENCYKDGFKQPLTLFCQRADYMTHQSEENDEKKLELKQHVLSMANADTSPSALSPNHTDTMVAKALHTAWGLLPSWVKIPKFGQFFGQSPAAQPPNHTDTMVAKALHMAWNQFGNSEAVILFLHFSPVDRLLIESYQVENEVKRISNGRTKCVFLLLREAIERLKLHQKDFSLILDDKFLVAVAVHRYSRATPQELTFTREIIRRSTAIQDSYHSLLAHTKRMQQLFTLPGVVERFFPRPEEAHMVKAIREVLTKSWSIGEGDEEAEEIIKNHFIFPNSAPILNVAATPELGIFGCLLGNIEDGTVLQQFSGEAHVMRTKLASENEGGVWKGKSVCDSPLLV